MRSSVNPARPNIWRFSILIRLTWPLHDAGVPQLGEADDDGVEVAFEMLGKVTEPGQAVDYVDAVVRRLMHWPDEIRDPLNCLPLPTKIDGALARTWKARAPRRLHRHPRTRTIETARANVVHDKGQRRRRWGKRGP